ncbi:cadherin-related family member 2 isoform X2 [Ascaphus truei]
MSCPERMLWIQFLLPFLLMGTASGNTAPVFSLNMTRAFVAEDTPVGVAVFWMVAVDKENDPLTYSIEGQDSYYFNVNQNTGEVELAFPLDFETKEILKILIKVQDLSNAPVIQNMDVIVEDCNDNAPIFHNTPYVDTIPENQPVGSIIMYISATDLDNGGKVSVTYGIDEVIPKNSETQHLFYILTNGSLVLNGSLNYNSKSTFYQLKIRATDRGGLLNNSFIHQSTIAYVSLDIMDLPDLDPKFINEPYVVSISENIALNTPILSVYAIDGDKGIDDQILYYIKNASVPGLLGINSITGEIYVSGVIDREALVQENEQILLEVVAQEKELNVQKENATSSTIVTIRVTDMNDNKPEFYNCEMPDCDFNSLPTTINFVGEVEEHSSVRVPVANLTITAHDPDKDQNGAFELYLQGPDANYFSVSPSRVLNTGQVQVLIRDSAAVDYEKVDKMSVEIVANDTGYPQNCCSSAFVLIHIIDINDHRPEFSQTTYKLEVLESCANGTSMGIITATDLDSGKLGEITYELLPESIRDNFQVNTVTGEITVVDGSLLDRERRSLYYATLQAQDGMNATGTTLLEITVLDINDEIPKATGLYNVFVNENTDDISIQIEAFDADEPNTNNSRIQFRLLPGDASGNFTINITTGLITSLAPLDREAIDEAERGRIVLTVELYDLGIPSLSSYVNVTINVEDLNDNGPVFNLSEYHFFVNESTKGAKIGSLQVSDRDQTEVNNRVSFRISQGGSGNFLIRAYQEGTGQYRGELSLDPELELDYEKQKNFTLIIEAQDNGLQGVSHTASATAIIQVLDLNDEPPYVEPSSLGDLYLVENRTVGQERLTTLKAMDPDTVHSLEFQELSVQCFKSGNDVGSICYDWLWLAPSGELFVNRTEDVDYELCDLMVMLLRVEDKLTLIGDRYSQNVSLRVVIEDINDHVPEFSDIDEAFVVVPDIAPIDYQVALVKAQDKDTGVNAVLIFSIISVEFVFSDGQVRPLSNIFTIITAAEKDGYVGSVRVASSLDVSLKGQYQVTVKATDAGSPPLSSTRVLDIFAVDQSYRVSLYFLNPADKVRDQSEEIKRSLTLATKATVYVAGITAADSTKNINPRATAQSIMYVYFVYSNGTAITPLELNRIIQSNTEALSELLQLSLYIIGGSDSLGDTNKNDNLYGVIAGLACAVLLILLIMIIALICLRKSHNRKLMAVKALKMANTLSVEVAQGGGAIPGTNKYNSDGANPMLNLTLDPIIDLGFEENSSTSDTSSVNSLDDNMMDRMGGSSTILPGFQESTEAHMPTGSSKETGDREEPLAAALNNRRQKTSQEMPGPVAYNNKALDTTEL